MFHMILQDHVIKGCMSLWKEALLVYPHPAKFGSNKDYSSSYIRILFCHMILQDHMIIWSLDFMCSNCSN